MTDDQTADDPLADPDPVFGSPGWAAAVAAVAADPGNDLPRLQAADLLDDHGLEVAEEFVRLQVALGRPPGCPSCGGRRVVEFDGGTTCHCPACTATTATRVDTLANGPEVIRMIGCGLPDGVVWDTDPGVIFWTSGPGVHAAYRNDGIRMLLVRRGFPDELRCRTRDLVRPCPSGRCHPDVWTTPKGPPGGRTVPQCRVCEDRRWVSGPLLPLLFTQPIRRVRLTDAGLRFEIDPPGRDYLWQVYGFMDGSADYFAMEGGLADRRSAVNAVAGHVLAAAANARVVYRETQPGRP